MHRFPALLHRFAKDERGVFAVMFGLMAIVLIATGGAVVDYVSLEQTRSRAQIALDAAALALQPEIFDTKVTKAVIKTRAQDLMVDRIGNADVTATIADVLIDVENGSLLLQAQISMPTVFVRLVGVNTLDARIISEATRKKLELEVVMVLDNSGSMKDFDRMTSLKEAATCATNILFFDAVNSDKTCTPTASAKQLDNVKMGIVPFTTFVNVGPTNASAAWIDTTGKLPDTSATLPVPTTASPISNDNFFTATPNFKSTGTFVDPVNRLALYDRITNDDWRGCVEARPHISSGSGPTQFYDTDDTPANMGNPATKFVPLFAPDLPDTLVASGSALNNYVNDSPPSCDRPPGGGASCQQIESNRCSSNGRSCSSTTTTYGFSGPVDQYVTGTNAQYVGGYPASCGCRTAWSWSDWKRDDNTLSNGTYVFNRSRTCSNGYIPTGLNTRELQERLCKYNGAIDFTTESRGPNADCPAQPILPMAKAPATVRSTINSMVALGGTNIHEGAAWGYRVLSPGEPFAQGNPYQEATSKVMILMTDGENTAYNLSDYCAAGIRALNGTCYYAAYGFPYNSKNTNTASSSGSNTERLGGLASSNGSLASSNAQLVTEMNTRTTQTCTNAKAAGITVYVIGLATSQAKQSTPAVVQSMLTQCASSGSHVFFPESSSALKSVFQKIAGELAALRLAQ